MLILGYTHGESSYVEHMFVNEYRTLITAADLVTHLNDSNWVVVDSRFVLTQPAEGRKKYLAGHVAGAVFADLNLDLASAHVPGKTGRHPLPSVEQTSALFSRLGIGPGVQVVAYDDQGGALAAARTWWMLRWLGLETAAVLDGGWQAWQAAGYPTHTGEETRPARQFIPHLQPGLIATADDVDKMRLDKTYLVMDARANDRYRGEIEPIDPVAGHIPGAISVPYNGNLNPDSMFHSIDHLRSRYQHLLGAVPVERTATYCGSGVTSIHNILAMQHAGLGVGRLYVGSWSDWITDPAHPVATGEA